LSQPTVGLRGLAQVQVSVVAEINVFVRIRGEMDGEPGMSVDFNAARSIGPEFSYADVAGVSPPLLQHGLLLLRGIPEPGIRVFGDNDGCVLRDGYFRSGGGNEMPRGAAGEQQEREDSGAKVFHGSDCR